MDSFFSCGLGVFTKVKTNLLLPEKTPVNILAGVILWKQCTGQPETLHWLQIDRFPQFLECFSASRLYRTLHIIVKCDWSALKADRVIR